MEKGFVKLSRNLLNNRMWLAEPFTRGQAWVDMFSLANHRDGYIRKRGVKVVVKRGQLGWSERALAERWKWSRGKVRRFLNELKKDENIVPQKSNVTTLITITNYDEYQGYGPQTVPQTDHKQYQNKNDKKDKKKERRDKKENFKPPMVEEVVSYFTSKGYSEKAARKAYDFYDTANWHDSRGNKVRNWKQKMIAVWFKDENKQGMFKTGNRMEDQNIEAARQFLQGGAP